MGEAKEQAVEIIREVDEMGDLTINFKEFVKMMKGQSQPWIHKTDKQKAKEERKRKKKEGTLKMEMATQAARDYCKRQTVQHGLKALVAQKAGRKSQGGAGGDASKVRTN